MNATNHRCTDPSCASPLRSQHMHSVSRVLSQRSRVNPTSLAFSLWFHTRAAPAHPFLQSASFSCDPLSLSHDSTPTPPPSRPVLRSALSQDLPLLHHNQIKSHNLSIIPTPSESQPPSTASIRCAHQHRSSQPHKTCVFPPPDE